MIPLFEFRIVDSYLPDLVLQGVQENDFRGRLSADLKLALQVSSMIIPIFAHHYNYVKFSRSACIHQLITLFYLNGHC